MAHLFQRFVISHDLVLKRLFPSSPLFQMKVLEEDVRLALAMLRRHINPLESPLYRLPPDLFPEVASHLASETDLVNATHISYHLRNTLPSHPNLWSRLDFRHEMRARAFFERSGQTPLHINLPVDTIRTAGSLAELSQLSERIATLKLRHWSVLKAFLSESLPSLRRIEVDFDLYDADDLDESQGIVWEEPTEEAASWSFPFLVSLILYNINPIQFSTPHLACFKFWDQVGTTNTYKLLSFLDNCPLLEHIDISCRGKSRNEQDLVVSLPNLRTCTETTSGQVCSLTVLNALSLPPFCSVTLKFWNSGMTAGASDVFLDLRNSDYLAEIKRVKARMRHSANGSKVVGTLELVNAKGTRLCSERTDFEKKGGKKSSKDYPHNVARLNSLRNLIGRSVEMLCIDGCPQKDVVAVEFLKEALDFGSVRALILTGGTVGPNLSALNEDPGAEGHSRWFSPIGTLIIHPDSDASIHLRNQLLQRLLNIAQKKKVAGFPLRSVSLFLCDGLGWRWDSDSELVEEVR